MESTNLELVKASQMSDETRNYFIASAMLLDAYEIVASEVSRQWSTQKKPNDMLLDLFRSLSDARSKISALALIHIDDNIECGWGFF